MEQRNLLIAHMQDLSDAASKTGCAVSRFLTPAEACEVARQFKYSQIAPAFDGGFEDAERTRAIFLNPEWGSVNRAEIFAALKVEYRKQDTLTHRDILGALMALGIERNTIGDIVCEAGCAVLVCIPELGGYLAENLAKAGRAGVTVSKISLDELPQKQENVKVKTDTVASLRLDAIVSAAFDLSRTKASELIESGRVSLNHQPCLKLAKEVEQGALLSVRGLGRAKLLEVGGTSKKGRIFVRIGLYGHST